VSPFDCFYERSQINALEEEAMKALTGENTRFSATIYCSSDEFREVTVP